jgi:hypothetical protein
MIVIRLFHCAECRPIERHSSKCCGAKINACLQLLKDLRECIVNELVYSEPQCNSLRAFFSLTAHPTNFVETFFAKKIEGRVRHVVSIL